KFGSREDRAFVDMYASDPDVVVRSLYADPSRAASLSALDGDGLAQLAMAQEAVIRFGWQPYLHNPKLPHRLGRIDVPTLVVVGDNDRFVLEDRNGESIADRIGKHADVETIKAAGHRIEEEAPTALASAITRFFGAH